MNPINIVDLHCHSYFSDGTFSPEGLVLLGLQQGLSALALTDHDTVEGMDLFHAAGCAHGLKTITGVELAAVYDGFQKPEIHIVGLGFDHNSPAMTNLLQSLLHSRTVRNERMVARITDLGFPLTLKDLTENAGGTIITRAHFANVLIQKGYVHTREEVFRRYLSQGQAGFVPREFLTPESCISAIHESGGVAILAHPTLYGLAHNQIDILCQDLATLGLDGLECHYPTYSPAQRKSIGKLAIYNKLLPSGGSDFHGANKPDIHLGVGRGNVSVPYDVWEALAQRCAVDQTQSKTANQPE